MPCLSLNSGALTQSFFKGRSPMTGNSFGSQRPGILFALVTVLIALGCGAPATSVQAQGLPPDAPAATLTRISSDPYTVGPGQHATEVEPHMLANGQTLVAAFQT